MATTTNYAWETPDDTDLVKDGAAAIRTLGSSVDTTTKALNPSTTLGDIEYRSSTANTNTRLGIGTTGQVLTVSGGVPAWSSPAGGSAQNFTLLSTTALTGAGTITISSLSGYNQFWLNIEDASTTAASPLYTLRLNADTTTKYSLTGVNFVTTPAVQNYELMNINQKTFYSLGTGSSSTTGYSMMNIQISGANAAGIKPITHTMVAAPATAYPAIGMGLYTGTSVISSISLICDSGTFDGGTIRVYGAA